MKRPSQSATRALVGGDLDAPWLFTELVHDADKDLWFREAHLQA
jgi:hypothetical protein